MSLNICITKVLCEPHSFIISYSSRLFVATNVSNNIFLHNQKQEFLICIAKCYPEKKSKQCLSVLLL